MFDLAVIGSGFAGSLMAMIGKRLGLSVVLIERGKHPRFAIGESSTPLANLLLEELATRYDLPMLLPLSKWGTWQRAHPQIACGLKRGFSFFHHRIGAHWMNDPERADQLLVAASPNEQIADTHWYRAEFDEFLASSAAEVGVTFVDEVELHGFSETASGVTLDGRRHGAPASFRARYMIDATGPHGFLHRALKITEAAMPNMPATEGLYAHFTGVKPFEEVCCGSFDAAPYRIDDAAMHHVFDGGWVWILRFNNGLTSAGVAATGERARTWQLETGLDGWNRVLRDLPSVAAQFQDAHPVTAFQYAPKLAFRTSSWAGQSWVQLPSAAAFIDPLLSTGFPLALLGITRLAEAIEESWGTSNFAPRVQTLSSENENDFLAAEQLVAALYAQMPDFPIFRALTLLYFAAVSFTESTRRLGKTELSDGFLLHRHPQFGNSFRRLCSLAMRPIPASERTSFVEEVTRVIAPFNVAGLGLNERRNWYAADPRDLLAHCGKLGVSRAEVSAMIRKTMG